MTNSLTKSPYKQMSHIFDLFVSQKFVVNQISLLKLTKSTLQASLSSSLLQKCDGGNAHQTKMDDKQILIVCLSAGRGASWCKTYTLTFGAIWQFSRQVGGMSAAESKVCQKVIT
jgi:hypothetical protein